MDKVQGTEKATSTKPKTTKYSRSISLQILNLTCAGKHLQQKQGSDLVNLLLCPLPSDIFYSPSCQHVQELVLLSVEDLLQSMPLDYCAREQGHLRGEHKLLHPVKEINC